MCSKFYLLHKHLMISGASGWFCGLSGLSREGASAMAPTSVSDMLQSLGLWYPVTVRWLVQSTLSALLISVFLRQDCSLCDPGLWLRVLPWCPPHSLDQTSHVFSVSGKESHVKHLLSGMALLWRMTPPPPPHALLPQFFSPWADVTSAWSLLSFLKTGSVLPSSWEICCLNEQKLAH